MSRPRLAIGLSVHTGWATCCVVGGDARAPLVVARETIEVLGDPDRFVFHRASELGPERARASVEDARSRATESARRAIGAVLDRSSAHGVVAHAAIVAKSGKIPPLEAIVASHPRIHASEGLFYRDVLFDALRSHDVDVRLVAPKEIVFDAETTKLVATLGRSLGPPWGKDEKTASLAALRVMGATPS